MAFSELLVEQAYIHNRIVFTSRLVQQISVGYTCASNVFNDFHCSARKPFELTVKRQRVNAREQEKNKEII